MAITVRHRSLPPLAHHEGGLKHWLLPPLRSWPNPRVGACVAPGGHSARPKGPGAPRKHPGCYVNRVKFAVVLPGGFPPPFHRRRCWMSCSSGGPMGVYALGAWPFCLARGSHGRGRHDSRRLQAGTQSHFSHFGGHAGRAEVAVVGLCIASWCARSHIFLSGPQQILCAWRGGRGAQLDRFLFMLAFASRRPPLAIVHHCWWRISHC